MSCCLIGLYATDAIAQSQVVLIKVYNQKLEPFGNEALSINGKAFVTVDKNGQLFTELEANDLPPKSVKLKNPLFEAATWSFTKGKLEIVVRARTHQSVRITVSNHEKTAVTNHPLRFRQTVVGTTDRLGVVSFDIPVNTTLEASQLELDGFMTTSVEASSEGIYQLFVMPILETEKVSDVPAQVPHIRPSPGNPYDGLDSIQSLPELYALFRQLELSKIDKEVHGKINEKFSELLSLRKSESSLRHAYTGMITDTSQVIDDIENLLEQARSELDLLRFQREEFDRSTRTIQNKLKKGVPNLPEGERNELAADLAALEELITTNEKFSAENHDYYVNLLSMIKANFLDISVLEKKLSASELRRLEQERNFRQRIILISALVILFGVLVVLLMRSDKRLRKVNRRIVEINENLEDIVSQRTKMLTMANKELDTFLYRASHDLRSPVCSILGLCNIASQVANPESQEVLRKVSGTVVIMDKLLKKLSVISEINQPSGYCQVSIKDSILDVVKPFNPTIIENKIDVRIKCDERLSIHTYPNLLEVVLTNIVENALFYSLIKGTENAVIEIEARGHSDAVEIVITDNGIGIDSQIKSRLFDMFFKGHENSKGNGLGLYIVLKSVHALNGEVEVESEPGQYSKFIVTLPRQARIRSVTQAAAEDAVIA